MAKSRVEKNKQLYDDLEFESFELEDLGEEKKKKDASKKENKQELIPVKENNKKNAVVKVEDKKVSEDEFVVEQPISYTDKLSVEEILRTKLEKQQELKNNKRLYKRSPVTDEYTAEMMQKNINQSEGIDIRKEANIKIKKNNNLIIILLFILLIAVIAAGIVVGIMLV